MAGVNQHYLPQFLQKGFTTRVVGKDKFTWLYRKGNEPVETRIRNIGSGSYFYGNPDEGVSADDAITELEGPFAALLDGLRNRVSTSPIDDPRVPSLVGHLAVRTKYVRETALGAGTNLLNSLTSHFPSQERMRSLLLEPDSIPIILNKHFPSWRNLSRVDGEKLKARYRSYVIRRLPEYWPIWTNQLSAGTEQIIRELRASIAASMNERLAETPAPEAVTQRLKAYKWTVLENAETLILGDTACVFEQVDSSYTGVWNTNLPVRRIFLPISSTRVLLGAEELPLSVNATTLNDAATRCSCEFFISAQRTTSFDTLHGRIGESAEMLSKQQAEELAKTAFLGLTLGDFL